VQAQVLFLSGASERFALSQAELALATSGVAGPSGGSAEKPVGLVWFGLATAAGAVRAESQRFQGDREAVRRQAVAHALRLIAAAAQPPGATGR
jgi:nicotinamide-nucleotide amidase